MDPILIQLVIYGTLAGLANVVGGIFLFPSRLQEHFKKNLRFILALGAGFMLAVTFIEIFPKSFSVWLENDRDPEVLIYPLALILAGYLITQFFEHTIAPHFHLGEEVDSHEMISPRAAYTAVGGLLIHTFFDGVSIAAVSQIDARAGALVFIAVFLHKIPEGFTISSMVVAAGKGFREVLISTILLGTMTLAGVILFYLIGPSIGFTVGYALPIAGGITLYVAASDLIPEINHHGGKNPLVSICVFVGVGSFFALHYLLHTIFAH